ncbi:hypothetical protein Pint_18779 [Pistacia integerrima]|uniref:Uncharacterized protein n=1 Tax=Pistacia integerrima TaxID=434235 RepID=A0ACC0YX50_9ROSI|nr:hypothetical protein Pint_18779 [Pistacia integerrima]
MHVQMSECGRIATYWGKRRAHQRGRSQFS